MLLFGTLREHMKVLTDCRRNETTATRESNNSHEDPAIVSRSEQKYDMLSRISGRCRIVTKST